MAEQSDASGVAEDQSVSDLLAALSVSVDVVSPSGTELAGASVGQLQARLGVSEADARRVHEALAAANAASAAPADDALDPTASTSTFADASAPELEQGGSVDLQQYRQLQQRIADLEGLQISAQVFQLHRQQRALKQELDAFAPLLRDASDGLAKAQQAHNKFSGKSQTWYPGKLPDKLLGKTGANIAKAQEGVEGAARHLGQRQEQEEDLQAALEAATARLAVWQAKAKELEAAHAEAALLERRLFSGAEEEQERLVDALMVLQEEDAAAAAAEGAGEEVAEGTAEAAAAEDGTGSEAVQAQGDSSGEAGARGSSPLVPIGKGGVICRLASRLGPARSGADPYGSFFRGRLIRMTADRLQKAAGERQRRREEDVQRVAAGIGVHGSRDLAVDASLAGLFPKEACSFNPAIHCPPSAFLFPYPSRFLGRLHRLQTGPVLQAFHRFGPFDSDPANPRRLIPRAPDGPPLILLSGLGSTFIAWGVPLLRALATCHEVIIMEYRGAGLSKNLSDQPWDYYNQAEAVLMLADALGISKFNFLGWSSGGNTGLVLAALHGDRLGRMVSQAGMAGGPNTIVPPAYAMLDPELSLTLGQTFSLLFPPDDAKEFHRHCANYIKDVFSMPHSITNAELSAAAAKEQWAADQEFILRDGRVWDALPGVRTPCLIMNGTKDVLVPHENAERIAARIPGAQLHTWEGWGHGWLDAGRFAAAVNAFLTAG